LPDGRAEQRVGISKQFLRKRKRDGNANAWPFFSEESATPRAPLLSENPFLKLTNSSINVLSMNQKPAVAKPRGRRPSVDDVDTRGHMLDIATALFAERGIAATTVAQIAAAAGVTSAMVHYYFTNREQLLDAIVDERLVQVIGFVWQTPDPPGDDDPFALVDALVGRLFDATARMPWLPPLWLREIVNEGGQLRERVLGRIPLDAMRDFAERIRHAQRAGVVNPGLDPLFLFTSINALVMLPLATSKVWHSGRGLPPLDRGALQRHVAALLGFGMRPPGVQPPPASRRARTHGSAT
jgi:AcrR family transcriptional regulator